MCLSWGEGWLGFPDLWSGQKPWWNWYLTPVVTFGEVRRAQLANPLSPGRWGTWDLFRSVQMLKRVWGAESNWKLPHLLSLVKLQPWFLSLQWKTCLWTELQRWFLSLQWKTCLWTELQRWFLRLQWMTCPRAELSGDDVHLNCTVLTVWNTMEFSFVC